MRSRNWKVQEAKRKSEANISFDIRQGNDDLSLFGHGLLSFDCGRFKIIGIVNLYGQTRWRTNLSEM